MRDSDCFLTATIFVVNDHGSDYVAEGNLGVTGSRDDGSRCTVTASVERRHLHLGIGWFDRLRFRGTQTRNRPGWLAWTVQSHQGRLLSALFEIFVECECPQRRGCHSRRTWMVEVRDKDQVDVVAEASHSLCMSRHPAPASAGPDTSTASECYSVTGYMGDKENEAMDQMRDDIEPHARPAHPTNPEMGQDTIEIFEGTADVQITVTSCEAGPVYIRFLDSDGDVFGTDVDECETCEGASGADVVGLDSQQKLELNIGSTEMDAGSIEMDAYMALKYDQYNVVTPGERFGQVPGRQAWHVLPGRVPLHRSV